MQPPPPAPPIPANGLIAFATRLVAAGTLPDLTSHQAAILESFDGARDPLEAAAFAGTSQRAGRRYIRALVAAHALLGGVDVQFVAGTAEQAGRARDDALELLRAYCDATGRHIPRVTLTVRPKEEDDQLHVAAAS